MTDGRTNVKTYAHLALFGGLVLALIACTIRQPESNKTVAAIEVPLFSAEDRTEFLAMLDSVASEQDLHIDSATEDEMAFVGKGISAAPKWMNATVWRGSDDGDAEVSMMDANSHPGRVWMMFSKGGQPELTKKFRDQAMRHIFRRWPKTKHIPIMPNGALPLRDDLIETRDGYKVNPAVESTYAVENDQSKRAPEAP